MDWTDFPEEEEEEEEGSPFDLFPNVRSFGRKRERGVSSVDPFYVYSFDLLPLSPFSSA